MRTLALLGSEATWGKRHLLLFCLPLFFIAMAETGMNFIFPLIVVKNGISNTALGLIMGFSALIAIGADMIFPQIRQLKHWKALLLCGIVLALFFPLLTLGGVITGTVVLFLAASISWFIFYELIMMSQQAFVVGDDKAKAYSKDWGIIYFAYASASIAGPIIAKTLDAVNTNLALLTMLLFIFFALMFAGLAAFLIQDHHRLKKVEPPVSPVTYRSEITIFKLFSKRLLPLMVLTTIAFLIEESFWNFGALLGDSLQIPKSLNWIILIIFAVPMLVGPLILSRFSISAGKKHLAIAAVFFSGAMLALSFFIESIPLLLASFFLTGIFLSFSGPLSDASESDYLKRLGHSQFYLLSLIRVNQSVAYLLAPVLSGILADLLGYKSMFATLGLTSAVIALILLLVTPKKIHMPQAALHQLEGNR